MRNYQALWRTPIYKYISRNGTFPSKITTQRFNNKHGSYFMSTSASNFQGNNDELVLFEIDPNTRIGILTFNSPKTYNSFTVSLSHQFRSVIQDLHSQFTTTSSPCDAIIVTGNGRAFSAGANLPFLHSLRENPVHINSDIMLNFYQTFLSFRTLIPVPVIAAVNGPAMGAGACTAIACDALITYPNVKLGFNFTRLGFHSGMAASHFLPLRMGGHSMKVNDILLTGKVVSGTEASEYGLVTRLVEDSSDVLEEAKKLAIEITSQNHPMATRHMVKTLRMKENQGLEEALAREVSMQAMGFARSDWGAGLIAAKNKEEFPQFDDYHSE